MRRALFAALAMLAAPALADDLWLGVYRHDVVIAQDRYEGGEDIKAGWIGRPFALFGIAGPLGHPSPHAIVSKHIAGGTDYLAGGLDWTFGSRVYARPGIGLALNNGPIPAYRGTDRVDLGSPITFEPEFALGWRVAPRLRIEASWIHLSHATLFSHQNRGLDSLGLRTLVRLR